jgi:hypothetical protein
MKLTIPKGIPDENSVITMQTKVWILYKFFYIINL